MQVSVESSGTIERKLTITIAADKITSEIDKRLVDVGRSARVPGFRPGKVPANLIRKRYRPQVTHEVVKDTISRSYADALGQEEIVPAGLVSIEPIPYEDGKDFTFVATVEVFPEIPNPTLQGRTVKRPVVEVTAEDIERTLSDIQQSNCDYEEKSTAAVKNDRLTIDFAGEIAGESFPGGSATDFRFLLGEGRMFEVFDTELLGCRAGDEKKIEFTFPADYDDADIAGKDVAFSVRVKLVEQPKLPELDDEFAKTLGVEEGGMARMREEIAENLQQELDSRLDLVMRDRVMDALMENNQFEVPKALIKEEIDRQVDRAARYLQYRRLPVDIDPEVFADDARRRVVLGLIARGVIAQHELSADQDAIRAHLEKVAMSYQEPEEYVRWHMSDPERRREAEMAVLEQRMVEKMLETATLQDEQVSFREFMNPQAT